LFSQSVPFEWEMDVEDLMERAFVLGQTAASPDPLPFALQYYGYSESSQYPGYLGYELESIAGKANNQSFYWQLSVNGVPSNEGADSVRPAAGSTVTWAYTSIAHQTGDLPPRHAVLNSLRAKRSTH